MHYKRANLNGGKNMEITKKQDPETYDAVMFCIKAIGKLGRPHWQDKHGIELLCVNQGRLITTDGHRVHFTRVNLPNGLYVYKKVKSVITLEPAKYNNKYPNVSNVIPKTCAHTITVQRKDLLRRCKQAKVISFDKYQGITLTFNGRLNIHAVNPDLGNMDAHVDTSRVVDPEIKIGMNVRYLIDALTGLTGKEITIGLNDETMPLIFRSKTQAALIMPMRV